VPNFDIDPDLAANYEAIVAERGVSYETLADTATATGDNRLAAWLRSKAAEQEDKGEQSAPRGRRAKADTAETASADVVPPPVPEVPVTPPLADAQ
jgi:hypothetical protein